MFVEVDLGAAPVAVGLAEPGDCTRFHVAVVRGDADTDADAGMLDRALRASATGSIDGDGEAVVRVDAVRRMAAGAVGESWEADFSAMLDYAASKGWLTEDRTAIRAHVEWE
ncbi:MAG TPA: hypothetical protein VMV22_05280 [Acidimicrobiales bacterium]|nr:hypothetical protein [Acidimicrobiales bacterium]